MGGLDRLFLEVSPDAKKFGNHCCKAFEADVLH